SLFPMVKATTSDVCEEMNTEISAATGIPERLVLFSTREYKKTRVRYFVPDYDEYVDTEKPDAVIRA
ncbi:MAG: Lrp/AsnC family transcriptional regulator, partial [Chloroflexota bacterium]|nr:Lrp/AsnC family transcriptional regulator [Chloroflexota bacterium]